MIKWLKEFFYDDRDLFNIVIPFMLYSLIISIIIFIFSIVSAYTITDDGFIAGILVSMFVYTIVLLITLAINKKGGLG